MSVNSDIEYILFSCFFKDDVRYNIARLRMKKRDALKGSEDSQRPDRLNLQANVRTGRRVALLPMENVSVIGISMSSAASDYDVSNVDESSRRQSEIKALPGLSSEEMAEFLKNAGNSMLNGSQGSSDEDEVENRFPAFGQTLPGLDPTQMASFLKKHADAISEEDDDVKSDSPEPQTLPGLNQEQMKSLLLKHQSEVSETNDDGSSTVSSVTE